MAAVATFANSRSNMPLGGVSPSARRHRLEGIREREEMKDQLFQKYRERFCRSTVADDQVSLASATIRQEIDRFMASAVPVTEANITRLERRLQHQAGCRTTTGQDLDTNSNFSVSSYTIGSSAPSSAGRGSRQGGGNGSQSARNTSRSGSTRAAGDVAIRAVAAPGGVGAGLEWSVLDKVAALMHKQDMNRQRSRANELKEKLRNDLDRQMADTRMKEERERDLERQYHAMQLENQSRLQQEENEKNAERQKKILDLRKNAAAQMEADRQRRTEERSREMKEAKELMDVINRDLDLEKHHAERRLQDRMEQAKEALRESHDAHRLREQRQQELAAREEQSVQEYQRLREAREQKAKEAQEKAYAAQKTIDRQYFNENRDAKGGRRDVARKALESDTGQSEDLHTVEIEKANREKSAQMKRQMQDYLCQQIKEKKKSKDQESNEQRSLRLAQEKDVRQFKVLEEQKTLARRRQNEEHRAELERQIAAKVSVAPDKEVMSECELRLNKQLLQRVSEALATIPG